jgi:hypothetical protein
VLSDAEILNLLAHCERATGTVLKQIRGNLRSRDWLSAVWELVVGEAASVIGRIGYEVGSTGSPQSDWLLELPDGYRISLEAAFALNSPETTVAQAKYHPAFRILRSKADRAKASAVAHPVVVCIGTDRVFQLGQPSGSGTVVSRDRVVRSFFEKSASLSAVIVVPILLRPEVLVGVARRAEPALLKNPRARFALSESAENHLQRLDFNARTVSIWTEPCGVRASLRKAIDQLGEGLSVPSTPSPGPICHQGLYTWYYTWRFNRLGIRRVGESYCLFDGNKLLGGFPSAEEAAQVAATLFQPYPTHVFGLHGIEPNPDRGVSPDLREWQYDPDGPPT